jgi:hypothetical protein
MRDKYEKRLEEYESEFESVHIAMAHRKAINNFLARLKKPKEDMEVILWIRENPDANAPGYTIPASQYEELSKVLVSCRQEVENLLDVLMFEGCDG